MTLRKKVFTILLSFMLVCSLLIGCSKSTEPSTSNNNGTDNSSSDKKEITFTMFAGNPAHETHASLDKTPFFEELIKRTGVNITFNHPPIGQEGEQFNLMLASNDLPDMISYRWVGFPGGPNKAIEDGIIIKLNDYIDEYAPNLKKLFEENPSWKKQASTDDGTIYMIPDIRGNTLPTWTGLQLRKDWLEELNLEAPTTIDEWETVLTAFKEKKNSETPLTFRGLGIFSQGAFIGAYGMNKTFYQVDGEVKFGPIEPEFKEFLITMNRWYEKGLIDPDFAAQDGKALDAKITGDQAGAWYGSIGGGMGRYIQLMKDQNPDFKVEPTSNPVLNKGETPMFGQKAFPVPGTGMSITTKCKNVEEAIKWLDYAYSEEGNLLFNFGIEGVTYEMVDGFPTYTEFFTNNPDGHTMKQMEYMYARSGDATIPKVSDPRVPQQTLPHDAQKKAMEVWANLDDSWLLPPVTPTVQESKTVASTMNDVNTYVDEELLKFIMGVRDIKEFDSFVKQIEKMNIQEVIDIKQSALERYNNR